jgi:enamine deaminase RidA (YjgF/YER057c/UK114 family)
MSSISRNISPTWKPLGESIARPLAAHYPAMALVQVVRLVENAARVEIEATAVVPR